MQIKLNIPIGPTYIDQLFDPGNSDHLPLREKAKEAFDLIKDLQKLKGWAFAKLTWLANRLDISKRHLQKVLKVLRDARLIEVKRRAHNYYRVNPLFAKPERNAIRRDAKKEPEQNQPLAPTAKQDSPAQELDEQQLAAKQELLAQQAAALTQEPAVEPEIKEAVEQAAKQVRKELRQKDYYRPATRDYLDKVKARLKEWNINVPGLLIGDVVIQYLNSW